MNPRYGITVYRISSPAHSTTLPSFRLFPIRRTGFAYYRKREVLSNLPLQIRTNSKLSLPEQLSGRKRRLRSDGALQHRPCTDEALREPSRCRQRSGSFRARRRACGRRRGPNFEVIFVCSVGMWKPVISIRKVSGIVTVLP